LANLAARKNNWNLAEKHFDTLKSLKNVTEPMIKEQTKELEKALKQRHQMKPGMMQQSGAFRPGGKRPRPRMR
jgi:uridine kinase